MTSKELTDRKNEKEIESSVDKKRYLYEMPFQVILMITRNFIEFKMYYHKENISYNNRNHCLLNGIGCERFFGRFYRDRTKTNLIIFSSLFVESLESSIKKNDIEDMRFLPARSLVSIEFTEWVRMKEGDFFQQCLKLKSLKKIVLHGDTFQKPEKPNIVESCVLAKQTLSDGVLDFLTSFQNLKNLTFNHERNSRKGVTKDLVLRNLRSMIFYRVSNSVSFNHLTNVRKMEIHRTTLTVSQIENITSLCVHLFSFQAIKSELPINTYKLFLSQSNRIETLIFYRCEMDFLQFEKVRYLPGMKQIKLLKDIIISKCIEVDNTISDVSKIPLSFLRELGKLKNLVLLDLFDSSFNTEDFIFHLTECCCGNGDSTFSNWSRVHLRINPVILRKHKHLFYEIKKSKLDIDLDPECV